MEDTSSKPRNLGGSLPVPNVQDLAADEITPELLERYLRGADAPAAAVKASLVVVPVVDLGRLVDPAHAEEEAGRLRAACEEWGFFQVVNHGVPEKIIGEVKEDVEAFFRLPLAEKQAVAQGPGGIEGYGQAFVVSEEQKLDWADMLFLSTQPPEYRSLNFWPGTLRASLERYSAEVQRVAADLLRAMARNLGLGAAEGEMMASVADAQAMRINYYPACPAAHEQVLGLSPHSDAVGLTLLLQVSPVPGLQIRRHNSWIPVEPLPGALVANIGDVVEVLTNGRYKSIEHRAVVSARHHRVSLAAFHSAKFDATYAPLLAGEPPRYRTIAAEDYVKLVLSSKLQGKNIMDAIRID
ncbi:hypothetical protein HU200_066594 [Digitaria exilis]|uniref:Fe2OG dioxygenase domain-containing protein n=1 Tax=Digitaria exilis TaxID=1010633 RepID=A0A835A7B8_9POAL|nr:hypothetical protein HU200_066594 [Digitaria exilis]CAB3492407.1 unnamed protein product [Digitaria exilis]